MSNPYDAVPHSAPGDSETNPYLSATDASASTPYAGEQPAPYTPPADPYATAAGPYAYAPPADPYAQPAPPAADPYAPYGAPAYGAYPAQSANPYGYAPPTNSTAVVALVAGIAGITLMPGIGSLVAVITGHIALGQIRARGEGGRGMALAGLIMGYVSIVGTLIAAAALAGFGWWAFTYVY